MRKFLPLLFIVLFSACSRGDKCILPSLKPEQSNIEFPNTGGSQKIEFTSNIDAQVITSADWLEAKLSRKDNNYTIEISAEANESPTPRTGIIQIVSDAAPIQIAVQQDRITETVGLYILSEGSMGQNNSELSYFDLKNNELYPKFYSENNKESLGDTANDMELYGTKLYIAVTGPNEDAGGYIDVVNKTDGKSIKRIFIHKEDGTADMPRRIITNRGYVYISSFGGQISRLDTVSLTIDKQAILKGGDKLKTEGLTILNGSIYACNSGFGQMNTISVVDMASMTEKKQIEVAYNPVNIEAYRGMLYFNTASLTWNQGPESNLYILNPNTEKIEHTFNCQSNHFAFVGDTLITSDIDWDNLKDLISVIDLNTKTIQSIKLKRIRLINRFFIDKINEDIYVSNTLGQVVNIYGKDFNLKKNIRAKNEGTNKVIPVYN